MYARHGQMEWFVHPKRIKPERERESERVRTVSPQAIHRLSRIAFHELDRIFIPLLLPPLLPRAISLHLLFSLSLSRSLCLNIRDMNQPLASTELFNTLPPNDTLRARAKRERNQLWNDNNRFSYKFRSNKLPVNLWKFFRGTFTEISPALMLSLFVTFMAELCIFNDTLSCDYYF